MTFLCELKSNVKPLFSAQAYRSLTELKSAIRSYKQMYGEDRETTYNLPMGGKQKIPKTPYKQREDRRKAVGQIGRSTILVLRLRQRAKLPGIDETRLVPNN
ncbi:hypothetical protein EVAR_5905_1 [Eumeta japonica]|uniref:Uncharacterized protein n=1 Tax=Eumeta variegata TaxID=151549 RepID=A0A4C1TD90_EUMVA|nr:hypothetical protein EVAR_5905_1 [Eumeta japonica]